MDRERRGTGTQVAHVGDHRTVLTGRTRYWGALVAR